MKDQTIPELIKSNDVQSAMHHAANSGDFALAFYLAVANNVKPDALLNEFRK